MAYVVIVLGWILIISGIIFLVKPEKARSKLLGQGFKIIKGLMIIAAVYLILVSISLAGKSSGMLTILCVFAVLAVIVAFLKLKKQAYLQFQEQFKKIPAYLLRTYAVIQIIIGVLMVVFKQRIM